MREPRLPVVCRTLKAGLPGGTRTFGTADEATPPDTARIQAALDSCAGTSGGVLLTTGRSKASFLSSPLTVHTGEYLVVDAGATLYATRDATAYQQPDRATCGSIGTGSTGCGPFIHVTGRAAGVEGVRRHGREGIIDGRGDQIILGTGTTWYQQADTAKAEGLKQVNPRLIQSDDPTT